MGGKVTIDAIPSPENNFQSPLHAFKKGLTHERNVTDRIYKLMDIATDEREHATISLLQWFIDKQVEEENTFNNVVKRLERIKEDSAALYMLDTELAARTFTPPTATV